MTRHTAQANFVDDAERLIRLLQHYREQSVSRQRPVIQLPPLGELVERLQLNAPLRQGGLQGDALEAFLERYLDATTRLHHPGFLAHQTPPPHPSGALGSLVDGFTNNPMAIYEMGPPAAAIELFMVNWLLRQVGWTEQPLSPGAAAGEYAGGVLTHGGSLANLTALIAARSRIAPEVWRDGNPGDLGLLASPQNHYSVARAAGILGLGTRAIESLEVDALGRIRPDRLPVALDRLRDAGRRPMALVANACSTALGLYDPLEEIAAFCREEGIWLHVDGAHGASALLSPKLRPLLRGIEQADSLIWDAHKMLLTPPLCAAVLVRDHRWLDQAFEQEASYLFHDKQQPGVDLIQRTVECTKAALGLKLYLVVAALGETGLARYVEEQTALAQQAWRYFDEQPDFSCPAKPQSNILCFAYADWNEEHLALRDRLIEAGDFHLSTARINDRWHLRAVFMNPETRMEDVEGLAQAIRKAAAE